MNKRIQVRCPYEDCKHEFLSGSKLIWITCSSCRRKINRLNNKINQKEKKDESEELETKD